MTQVSVIKCCYWKNLTIFPLQMGIIYKRGSAVFKKLEAYDQIFWPNERLSFQVIGKKIHAQLQRLQDWHLLAFKCDA